MGGTDKVDLVNLKSPKSNEGSYRTNNKINTLADSKFGDSIENSTIDKTITA